MRYLTDILIILTLVFILGMDIYDFTHHYENTSPISHRLP